MAKKEFLNFEGLQRLVDNINSLKANIDSPIFKGEPTSPTPNINDKSTRIATTEYVNNMADKFKLEVGGSAQVVVTITPATVATVILTNRTSGATYQEITNESGIATISVSQFGTYNINYKSSGAINSVQTVELITPGEIKYISATYTTSRTFTAKIDLNNSNPKSNVTYYNDATSMTKGSKAWDSELIFKDIKPCVFKDGQVVYYLDKEDCTLKEGGDTANLDGTDGDVMVEFPKFAYKIWSEVDEASNINNLCVSITNNPQYAEENNYKYYAFSKTVYGDRDHFYWGSFKGSIGDNNALRSIAGVAPASNRTIGGFKACAQANGDGYTITSYFQLIAIQCLYIIKYGSLDGQTALGQGICGRSDTSTAANYGPLQTGGTTTFSEGRKMYYGSTSNNGSSSDYEVAKLGHVKFAGIEDFWGNIWEWIDGMTTDANRNIITKWNYDSDDETFTTPSGLASDSNGWVKKVSGTTESGFMGVQHGGSSTTYYCDYGNLYASRVLLFGGRWNDGAGCGPFHLSADATASAASGRVGARLMYL